jgi:phospholipid/cholesterol/gamma-HCH transport system ATP-binding protein
MDARMEVEDVTFGYGTQPLFRNVSFGVSPGTVFFIIGGSGCGKSSLFRLILGLERPFSGEIRHSGVPLDVDDGTAMLQTLSRVGVLFQSGGLLSSLTVFENVTLPLLLNGVSREEAKERATKVLESVSLARASDQRPATLSGGMKRLAGIARALVTEPDLLLLDEPTSGLDPISAARMDDLIADLAKEGRRTVVVVSHDLGSILSIADDGILLDREAQGVIASGKPSDLLASAQDPRVVRFLSRGKTSE